MTSSSSSSSSSSHSHSRSHNGASNGNNGSNLLLYKWTPISQSQNQTNGNGVSVTKNNDDANGKDETPSDEPPRRKFKYIPVISSHLFNFFSYFHNCVFFSLTFFLEVLYMSACGL